MGFLLRDDQNLLKEFLRELGFYFLLLKSCFKAICAIFSTQNFNYLFQNKSFRGHKTTIFIKKTVCLESENGFLDELTLSEIIKDHIPYHKTSDINENSI
jgi:hypothetical protein